MLGVRYARLEPTTGSFGLHPSAVAVAAVDGRGGKTALIRSRLERQFLDLGTALRARPHHSILGREHRSRPKAGGIALIALKHL